MEKHRGNIGTPKTALKFLSHSGSILPKYPTQPHFDVFQAAIAAIFSAIFSEQC